MLEAWLKKIHVKCDSCLDVGGGELSVKNRVGSFKVREYKIFDHDAKFKPDYLGDLNFPMTEELKKEVKKFDVVFCLEVSEYLYKPWTAMENLYNFLKPGGILYVTFCTNYPLHNPPKIDYIRYTKNFVEKLLKESGFKSWEITPRPATRGANALAEFWRQEAMHPMRGTAEIYDLGYCVKAYKGGVRK